jgi:peptide/nickel transport system permease protein
MTSISYADAAMSGEPEPDEFAGEPDRSLLRALRRPAPAIGIAVLLIWLVVAALAGVLSRYDPNAPTLTRLAAPSSAHWLGTDEVGRDVFSRVIHGARVTLPLALVIVSLTSVLGSVVGAIAGLTGGLLDSLVMRITDMFFAFPGIVLTMALAAALGASLENAVLAIVIVNWPPYARVARSLVLGIRTNNYITTSRLLGMSPASVLMRDIVPNVIGPVIVLAMLDLGNAVLLLAGLSFLGLGAQPPTAEWGAMISAGAQNFSDWWIALFPGLAILTVAFAANTIGDALRDYFDPQNTLTARR